ncbi:MAG: D-xylose ABC transporter ATP-binding protein [Devosia sp. 67-54]|uniref:sugar ABC transporter ATP-binding protein n=1 Tax=unclassified Devosia TaxID=196773 RepID=UPI00095C1904|nr:MULTISPECIES: sugar ABC transporter ATP-binding protein [unclassified Devosia]MBN9304586.1 sugar ABC transporter ATP-binding protein [Devosia sp.]OJX15424.1 MAG: D-xylose ABC transporter ATP-binding protein [Devosia sp. 67-54]
MTSAAAASAPAPAEPFLVLSGIRKAYPGVLALQGFSMSVAPGEVIGLVGENGAGKSTLMKILGGVIAPDAGTITIDGVEESALSVAASMRAGIAFVHQELNLFDNLDVAANVYIGREPRTGGLLNIVDTAKQRQMVAPFLKRLGASFGPATPVSRLSLAQQQMVEIAKALSMHARLVILDEPTSSLPLSETAKLLDVIAALKRDGISVIFISHRLHEIKAAADRVIVLRDGKLAGTLDKAEIEHDRMVKLMIGRDLKAHVSAPAQPPGKVAMRVSGVRTATYPGQTVDLELRSGEILGIAGLVGSGRTELARAMFGIDPIFGGSFELDGAPFQPSHASRAVERGLFLVPEDRKLAGLLLDLPITQNISLPDLPTHARNFMVSTASETRTAETQRRNLGIKAPQVSTKAANLSGGNQQKVVLGKWLAMSPKVMIFDEPTRGIDVGAKAEIYRLMRGLADAGVAVMMISSDMEEVIGVSDRIAVMHEGRISGTLDRDRFSEENVLQLAVGKPLQQEETAA